MSGPKLKFSAAARSCVRTSTVWRTCWTDELKTREQVGIVPWRAIASVQSVDPRPTQTSSASPVPSVIAIGKWSESFMKQSAWLMKLIVTTSTWFMTSRVTGAAI
jgi:hypothetical protein